MFGSYGALLGEGVLGLNKRNGDYISRFNPRRLYPLVDDKLKTKRLALAAGIGWLVGARLRRRARERPLA